MAEFSFIHAVIFGAFGVCWLCSPRSNREMRFSGCALLFIAVLLVVLGVCHA